MEITLSEVAADVAVALCQSDDGQEYTVTFLGAAAQERAQEYRIHMLANWK